MTFSRQRAAHKRLHIAVPVRIEGVDRQGTPFDREAWTLNVSEGGAAIQVPSDLELPDRFHVRADDYQFRADADVLLVWSRTNPQHSVGVRVVPGTRPASWQAR